MEEECSICRGPFRQPVMVWSPSHPPDSASSGPLLLEGSGCQHVFCFSCISAWKSSPRFSAQVPAPCPICRGPIPALIPDKNTARRASVPISQHAALSRDRANASPPRCSHAHCYSEQLQTASAQIVALEKKLQRKSEEVEALRSALVRQAQSWEHELRGAAVRHKSEMHAVLREVLRLEKLLQEGTTSFQGVSRNQAVETCRNRVLELCSRRDRANKITAQLLESDSEKPSHLTSAIPLMRSRH